MVAVEVEEVVELRVCVLEVEEEVAPVHHKLALEVGVVAVEEVVALGVGVLEVEEEVADRTALPGLVVAVRVRVRRFQQLGPGPEILPAHPTREALAQQTLSSRVARSQQT
jgi:hypothetical protein